MHKLGMNIPNINSTSTETSSYNSNQHLLQELPLSGNFYFLSDERFVAIYFLAYQYWVTKFPLVML